MRFSVIIPCYNNAEYLPACLESIQAQSLADWEAVVVIDGSPDNSAEVAKGFAAQDSRIRVIDKPHNEGTHLARKSGVAAAEGDWVLFMDADDEWESDFLYRIDGAVVQGAEQGNAADVLHVGMKLFSEGMPEETVSAFEEQANAPLSPMAARKAMERIFGANGGYVQDWRVTQRVFAAPLAKRAFAAMTDERLGRGQDSYECFVLMALAKREVTRNDIDGYLYHLGRGITNSSVLDVAAFLRMAQAYEDDIEALFAFTEGQADEELTRLAHGLKQKLLETLGNDWRERVADGDKLEAAHGLMDIIGADETIHELARFVRDEAYRDWEADKVPAEDEPYLAWWDLVVEQLACIDPTPRTLSMVVEAQRRFDDIAAREAARDRERTWDAQRIRIFVAAHKDVDLFESNILQPVQVGSAGAAVRFGHMLHDDEGDNISELNAEYCELTAQYWAWKNVDADYYGFCHYRRYFDFSDERHEENDYGEIIDDVIDAETQARYGLDDANIARAIEGFDVVTTEIKDLRKFPFRANTPLEHYAEADLLKANDLPRIFSIVKEMHPDYAQDVDAFANGNFTCFCNMYILRKQVFFDYCEWMFPILERFCDETDMRTYSREARRTPGHLSERLFNIYLNHALRTGANWKTKQVQCVHFDYPDRTHPPMLHGLQGSTEKPVVPVVFAADNDYVPMLTTTMSSMLENASPEAFYDVVVLENGITGYNQSVMRRFLEGYNVSVRFVNASALVAEYDLSTNNEHIGIETYFRFLIQDILPDYDKVLYLDSDLIVQRDVAELFATDLGENLVAAVRDIDFLGNLNLKDGNRLRYNAEVLHMKNPYDYFQAGVLVLNTAAMRRAHTVAEWLTFAANPDYIYNDQDVLNACCEGRVTYLDPRWNVMNDCGNRIANVFQHAPAQVYNDFLAAREDMWIIHYAGFEKPWRTWYCDLNEIYWEYARETPFYEVMLSMLLVNPRPYSAPAPKPPALPVGRAVRKIVNPIMPVGSKRRETVKGLAHKVLGH